MSCCAGPTLDMDQSPLTQQEPNKRACTPVDNFLLFFFFWNDFLLLLIVYITYNAGKKRLYHQSFSHICVNGLTSHYFVHFCHNGKYSKALLTIFRSLTRWRFLKYGVKLWERVFEDVTLENSLIIFNQSKTFLTPTAICL